MRLITILFLCLFQFTDISAQGVNNKFRVDYNYVCLYDGKTKKWGDWQIGENTFIININERGDIAHLMANGKTVIYKKISDVEKGYTTDGKSYQIIKAIDENGDLFSFQIFDDAKIGLKLIFEDYIFQFIK